MRAATGSRTGRERASGSRRAVTHPLRAWLRGPRAAAYLRRAGRGGRPLPPRRALPAASALRLRPTPAARSRQPLLCTCVPFRSARPRVTSSRQPLLCVCFPRPKSSALRQRTACGAAGSCSFSLGLGPNVEVDIAAGGGCHSPAPRFFAWFSPSSSQEVAKFRPHSAALVLFHSLHCRLQCSV